VPSPLRRLDGQRFLPGNVLIVSRPLRERVAAIAAGIRMVLLVTDRQPEKGWILGMLLDSRDLPEPDGWKVAVERAYSMGRGKRQSEETRRARKSGGISGWRGLDCKPVGRSVLFTAASYASPADAHSSLSNALGGMIRPPFSKVNVVEAKLVEAQQVAGLTEALIYEERSEGRKGSQGTRLVGGSIEHVRFAIYFNALGEPWPWSEVTAIAGLQVTRIRQKLAENSPDRSTAQQ
jgi:hypothetical protein